MKKKIYIAGKVTGEPIAQCTMKFGNAQKQIEALGFEVVNPLALVNDWKAPWHEAMKKCLKALIDCDGVLMLDDWHLSKGAKIELQLAISLGLSVQYYNTKFQPVFDPRINYQF
ncbi:DUF4406 domain-containing protein [Flavobacterium geliluteum]|uniref:DUF4406 domain-containing protein n=1 Tax=Flavobacterium geliluteum TaxID=2816120 RepID=A0A941B016_9FLAO|nr:DUF4406 domain-containing protein [Flavobacterium geliluteum]MBP4139647.1 DUF4406 domain-containing protein [Flavobacterium geliluteum]